MTGSRAGDSGSAVRRLGRETAVYSGGSILASALNLLLIPLFAKSMPPHDYGVVTLYATLQTLVETLSGFGISVSVFRYYVMDQDPGERAEVLGTCLRVQAGTSLLALLAGCALAAPLGQAIFDEAGHGPLVAATALTAVLSAVSQLAMSLMRIQRRPELFVATQFARSLTVVGAGIVAVLVLHAGYPGVVLGQLAAHALVGCATAVWLVRHAGFAFSRAFAARLLRFAWPICLANVLAFVFGMADGFFVNHYVSTAQVAIYALGNRIGNILQVGFIRPFCTAMVPHAMAVAFQPEFPQTFARLVKQFLVLVTAASIVLFVYAREIIGALASPQYQAAAQVVPWALLVSVLYGVAYNVSVAINITERTQDAVSIGLAGALTSLALNFALTPRLGLPGAIAAAVASNAVVLAVTWRLCQRQLPVAYDAAGMWRVGGIALVYAGLRSLVEATVPPGAAAIAAKALILLALPVMLRVARAVDDVDLAQARALLGRA